MLGEMEGWMERWMEGQKDRRMDRPYFIGPFQLPPGVQKFNKQLTYSVVSVFSWVFLNEMIANKCLFLVQEARIKTISPSKTE